MAAGVVVRAGARVPAVRGGPGLYGRPTKEEVVHLLQVRAVGLQARIAAVDTQLGNLTTQMHLPRLFMIEGEYGLAMDRAELEWVRRTIQEIQDGKLWITHEQMKAYEQSMTSGRGS